ncbi:MAG: polyprenyl synthetase family protein [Chloroflexota bacterium]|nr:polyprenyl synthetase family protein [Chloroflexota bacterium]
MPLDSFDSQLDAAILSTIAIAGRQAAPSGTGDLPIYDILRYHLGFLNEHLEPERVNAGKRIRPRLCVLTCQAAGGDPVQAMQAAASIELLHNFTLIHDDIQDQSVFRRHRRTIWDLWGAAQAINAGDAMFALAHLALNHSIEAGVGAATVLELSSRLHDATLRIVEGQVLDLGFEQRNDVAAADYLTMIGGKTGALARCACWTGARIAGAGSDRADQLAEFGAALGIGFQLRDDILGVWGETGDTGKSEADDIRRRKKSLPVLLLRERASLNEQTTLDAIYEHDDVTDDEIETVLAMMRFHEIAPDVQEQVRNWHDRARDLLEAAVPQSAARNELFALVESLEGRAG